MAKRKFKDIEEYKIALEEKYDGKYKVISGEYKNTKSVLEFECKECGYKFKKKAESQLNKGICENCNKTDRYKFIWKSIQKNGYILDYREVNYIDNSTPITLICDKHGKFQIIPFLHYINGKGCDLCNNPNMIEFNKPRKKINKSDKFSSENIRERVYELFGDSINIDNIEYESSAKEFDAYCNIHNIYFKTNFHNLLRGIGCNLCGIEKSRMKRMKNVNEVIDIANNAHDFKYDYSEIDYKGMGYDIFPICKIHGKFRVNAYNHLYYNCGCPECSERKHYNEKVLYDFIKLNYNDAIHNYHNSEIFGRLSLDIYIPSLNVGIEFQGEQHFRPINYFGGNKSFQLILKRDRLKRQICNDNNIELLYYTIYSIPNDFNEYFIYTDRNQLLDDINKKHKV